MASRRTAGERWSASFPEWSGQRAPSSRPSKIWQKEWFYITEPRSADWGAIPAFRSGPPTRLVSWTKKGLDWGVKKEVALLQSRIAKMIEKGVELTNVIQIMLGR
jgi:hypothetical protein